MSDSLEAIHSDSVPAAIGPYSQAVRCGDLLFCSGQISLDPATMTMVGEGDVAAQAEQVMTNLRQLVEAGGSSFDSVVKTTIFLADMADFATVNEIYGRHFAIWKPARACVAARELPKGALVEIDCVASCS